MPPTGGRVAGGAISQEAAAVRVLSASRRGRRTDGRAGCGDRLGGDRAEYGPARGEYVYLRIRRSAVRISLGASHEVADLRGKPRGYSVGSRARSDEFGREKNPFRRVWLATRWQRNRMLGCLGQPPEGGANAVRARAGGRAEEMSAPVKVSRNDPCPCGSGRKYKRCCFRPAAAPRRPAFPAPAARRIECRPLRDPVFPAARSRPPDGLSLGAEEPELLARRGLPQHLGRREKP